MSSINNGKPNVILGIKEFVLDQLKNYRDTARQIQMLRYEMEHRTVSAEDVISEMAFAKGDDTRHSISQISNKTLFIALNYQEKVEKYQTETAEEIASRLWALEHEQNRLIHFVSLLDGKQAAVIRQCYFEGKSREDIAVSLSIGVRSVQRLRNMAIDELCQMYGYISELK